MRVSLLEGQNSVWFRHLLLIFLSIFGTNEAHILLCYFDFIVNFDQLISFFDVYLLITFWLLILGADRGEVEARGSFERGSAFDEVS